MAMPTQEPTTLLRGKYGLVTNQRQDLYIVGVIPILGTENHIQKQQLGGGLTKNAEGTEAVGYDSAGSRKYGINGAVPGSNVKGGGAVVVTIRKRELGGDRGYAQGTDSIPP